jgi:hypothetical protein
MCAQCDDLQKQITRYRCFLKQFDPLTEKRIGGLIADLEQRKDLIHEGTPVSH